MANAKKEKKTPKRHCAVCAAELDKTELLRIVRSPEGNVSLDLTGKASGRGAYLCKRSACIQKARKSGKLSNALGTPVPDAVYEELQDQAGTANGQ